MHYAKRDAAANTNSEGRKLDTVITDDGSIGGRKMQSKLP